MRVRNSHSIIPTTAYTPRHNPLRINPRLFAHPIQDATPQALGTGGIAWISGTVTCAWNLDGDGGPAVGDVVARWHGVLETVGVEAVDVEDCGKFGTGVGVGGEADGDGDGGEHFAREGFGVGVGDEVLGQGRV